MMTLPEKPFRLVLGWLNLIPAFRLHRNGVDRIGIRRLDPNHLTFRRGNREDNNVVLILSGWRLPLWFEDTDDSEWHILDSNGLSDGINVAEKTDHNGL